MAVGNTHPNFSNMSFPGSSFQSQRRNGRLAYSDHSTAGGEERPGGSQLRAAAEDRTELA